MESSLTFAFESWMICETPEDNWTGAGWAALVVVESCAGTLRAARTSTAVMVTVKNKPRELLVFIKSTPISSTPHTRASCADCQMASRVWGLGSGDGAPIPAAPKLLPVLRPVHRSLSEVGSQAKDASEGWSE